MRRVLALPLLAIATPAWGQVAVREECSAEYLAVDPDTIIVDCTIMVTGNLVTSRSENSESIVNVRHNWNLAQAFREARSDFGSRHDQNAVLERG